MTTLVALLQAHGRRATIQRQLVVDQILMMEGEIEPEAVRHAVAGQFPTVTYGAVTQALRVLLQVGLIGPTCVVAGNAHFHRTEYAPHVHLVCKHCGNAQEIVPHAIGEPLREGLKEHYGFNGDLSHLVITGCCSACADRAAPS